MRRSCVFAGVIAATCLLAASSMTAVAETRGVEGRAAVSDAAPVIRLLYQEWVGDRTQVAVIGSDGGGGFSPTAGLPGGNQTNPDWSPDGRRIVFGVTGDDGRDDLWTARPDRSHPRWRVLLDCRGSCVYLDDPAWSPDGTSIAYARVVQRGSRGLGSLEILDLRTGVIRTVLGPDSRRFFAGVRWSPDGRQLVVEDVHKTGVGLDADVTGVTLAKVNPRRGLERALTDPALFAATAAWSPDGRTIVYSALPSAASAAPDLFTLDLRSGRTNQVTWLGDAGGYATEPTFGPDGTSIYFSGQRSADEDPGMLLRVDHGGAVDDALGRPLAGQHPRWDPSVGPRR